METQRPTIKKHEQWHTDIARMLRKHFRRDVQPAAKKEMENGRLKAITVEDEDSVAVSLALYQEHGDKICIMILQTEGKWQRKGACRSIIEEMKLLKKDLYLETSKFSVGHAIFERMGFAPQEQPFTEFASGERLFIPESMRPICLKLPVNKEEHNYLSLDLCCYHQEKAELGAAHHLLDILKDSPHALSRHIKVKRDFDVALLDNPGTLEELMEQFDVAGNGKELFLQFAGKSLLEWLEFQVTKARIDLSSSKITGGRIRKKQSIHASLVCMILLHDAPPRPPWCNAPRSS